MNHFYHVDQQHYPDCDQYEDPLTEGDADYLFFHQMSVVADDSKWFCRGFEALAG